MALSLTVLESGTVCAIQSLCKHPMYREYMLWKVNQNIYIFSINMGIFSSSMCVSSDTSVLVRACPCIGLSS